MLSCINQRALRSGVIAGLALCLLTQCKKSSMAPDGESAPPAPGTRATAETNAAGVATLILGGTATSVNVRNADGSPAAGMSVAASVGRDVILLVAADRTGARAPAISVHPVSSISAMTSDGTAQSEAAIREPLTITLAVIGTGLALHELISDPIHEKLVLDDGILKSCVAGDLNDLTAVLSPLMGLGSKYLIVSVLGKSRTFAMAADLGQTAIQELLTKLDFMDRDRPLPLTCRVLVGDQNFTTQLLVISAVTGGGVIAQDDNIPSILHFVEPTSSGQDFPLKALRTADGSSLQITDLAHWDRPAGQLGSMILSNPELYAVSFSALYRLNRTTGIATEIGLLGNTGVNALAFDRTGTLYAATLTGELLVIDLNSGTVLKTVVLTPAVASSGDVAFLPDGRLVATVLSNGGDDLVEISTATGAVRTIGPVGFYGVFGLSVFGGNLWGLTVQGELLRLDPSSGRGTLIRRLAFRTNGANSAFRTRADN